MIGPYSVLQKLSLCWCQCHGCAPIFTFNPIFILSEWSDHQQGHWPVPGGRDVQRRQLRPTPGGPEMLRSEVDDPKLDQASPALRREPETVWTAFLVAVGSRILDDRSNRRQTGAASVRCFIVQTALICPRAAGLSSTESLRNIWSISTVFHRAVRWQGPYGVPRCLKRPTFSEKKNLKNRLVQNRETRHGSAAPIQVPPGDIHSSVSSVNYQIFVRSDAKACLCLCAWAFVEIFFLFLSFFWAHPSKSADLTAVSCHIEVIILGGCDLENCFKHVELPLARRKIDFRAAARHPLMGRHLAATHTKHCSFFGLYCSLSAESNHVPFFPLYFFLFVCLIRPGNVSPESM